MRVVYWGVEEFIEYVMLGVKLFFNKLINWVKDFIVEVFRS